MLRNSLLATSAVLNLILGYICYGFQGEVRRLERYNAKITEAVLIAGNGGGFELLFEPLKPGQMHNAVSVSCHRISEWRDGDFYLYVKGKPVKNGHRDKDLINLFLTTEGILR